MTVRLHRGDLPDLSRYGREVAIDTETMGLDPRRDRLCVVQLSPGDGSADVVQIPADLNEAPNLVTLLADPGRTKIFHYARFDIAVLKHRFGVVTGPVYCTKIASKLVRTYTDRHGLKDLVARAAQHRPVQAAAELGLGRREDLRRAARIRRLGRALPPRPQAPPRPHAARARGASSWPRPASASCPTRIELDLMGWDETDIFAHS